MGDEVARLQPRLVGRGALLHTLGGGEQDRGLSDREQTHANTALGSVSSLAQINIHLFSLQKGIVLRQKNVPNANNLDQ